MRKYPRLSRTLCTLSFTLLLAACGGGSGSDSPPNPDSNPSSLDSPTQKALAVGAATTWGACSREYEVCNFAGTQRVRYGIGTSWVEGVYTNTVNCTNATFEKDPAFGQVKSCQTQAINWQACANEGQTCNFTGRKLVRYGAGDKWVVRELENTVACNNTTFGDPAFGTYKSCQTAPLKSAPDAPPLTPNAWSNPATWGGTVPSVGASVVIPAGKTVLLDAKVKVKSLTINGTLSCSGKDIAIDADWVLVSGAQAKFSCGTKAQPFLGKFDVVLDGPKTDNIMGMGARVLGAMGGATIEMFGEPRTGWTKLDATARKGSTTLTLADAPRNWRAGMDIVIGSSTENPREAEVRRIQSINGKAVTLSSALSYDHFGEQQRYNNGRRTYVADTRAPVGLLSRNITIQGGGDSESTQFGAHMMTMVGAKAYVSDIGFNRMGQKGVLGRYPFHWHLAGDVRGQFVNNSSIWESYNRCFTIHGSDNALVEGNVCYNHLGHGYFLEDGTEQGNTIQNNLAVLSVKPKAGEAVLDSDTEVANASRGPAAFWISNPNNTIVGNQTAGSDGSGFWYSLDDRLIPRAGAASINPRVTSFLKFENNIASGTMLGFSTCQKGGEKGMETPNEPVWKNLTVFMTADTGVWPCGLRRQTYDNLRLLDAGRHAANAAFTAPTPMLLKDSLFVANSALSGLNGRTKIGRSAVGFYDQGFNMQNVHFVGYTKADKSSLLSHVGGAVKKTWNYVEGVTFSPTQFAAYDNNSGAGTGDAKTGSVIFDIDGSFGAGPNMTLMPKAPIFEGMDCPTLGRVEAGSFGTLCKTRIVRSRIVGLKGAPYTMFRSGSSGNAEQKFANADRGDYIQPFAAANQSHHFGVRFDSDPGTGFTIMFQGLWPSDKLRYELRGMRANAAVASSGFRQVTSASAFESTAAPVWYRAGSTLHFKIAIPATATQWKGAANVKITNN